MSIVSIWRPWDLPTPWRDPLLVVWHTQLAADIRSLHSQA